MEGETIDAAPNPTELELIDVYLATELFKVKPFRCCDVRAFRNERHPLRHYRDGTDWQYIPSGKPARTHLIDAHPLPRASQDLRVAAQCEAKLTMEQREHYGRLLRAEVCSRFNVRDNLDSVRQAGGVGFLLATATAEQRARALVSVLRAAGEGKGA